MRRRGSLREVVMTEADRKRFAAAMGSLGVAFDLAVTAPRMGLYFDALRDLTIEAVEWAAKEVIRQEEFFPRAKRLRDYAAMAPRPKRPALAGTASVLMLEELTPVEEQRAKWEEIKRTLNREFGTTFAVRDELGRPALVSEREEDDAMKRRRREWTDAGARPRGAAGC